MLLILFCIWIPPPLVIPSPLPFTLSSSASNSCYGCSEAGSVIIEGPLRRKTLLKEGRKPRVRWSLIALSSNMVHCVSKGSIWWEWVFSAYPFIWGVAVVVVDQILDHSVWINTDILWGESTEGLWEETCKFDAERTWNCSYFVMWMAGFYCLPCFLSI